MSFLVRVFENSPALQSKLVFESDVENSFRIGRQEGDEDPEIGFIESKSDRSEFDLKLVIAAATEREYSRQFAEIVFEDDEVEILNSSGKAIFMGAEPPLDAGEKRKVNTPCEFTFVERTVRIADSVAEMDVTIRSLPTLQPPSLYTQFGPPPSLSLMEASTGDKMSRERLLELLQTMLQIFQESPSGQPFFDHAAEAMSQLLELDHALIAFQKKFPAPIEGAVPFGEKGDWLAQVRHSARKRDDEWKPSFAILNKVKKEKKTVYQIPDMTTESLLGVKSLVASPLLSMENEVIGVVYGDRLVTGINQAVFTETEAMFVELFAKGISIGIERLNRERKISEMRSRFDQFFTPELARQLESDEGLLKPRSAQVSVLFADIRGFSRISESIGPDKTIKWINSLMSELSDCILKFDGVVVDYIGDEVMAMWGAPIDRDNHAELAVRAALEMKKIIPDINRQWESIVGERIAIGIGINSGEAQVGNTGSSRKFKYGPLGDVVNIGSRMQGATKQLKADLLISQSTFELLPKEILTRKIRSVRFVNVQRAVTVFEVPFEPDENWIKLKEEYEKGLDLYESGELRRASQQMAPIINQFPNDGPAMLLLSDSVSSLAKEGAGEFDFVWDLPQK